MLTVSVNGLPSDPVVPCTGSPQGWCFSPLLFSCRITTDRSFLIKLLMTLLCMVMNMFMVTLVLTSTLVWRTFLCLGCLKDKWWTSLMYSSVLSNYAIEVVDSYKYLVTIFDNQGRQHWHDPPLKPALPTETGVLLSALSFSVLSVIHWSSHYFLFHL